MRLDRNLNRGGRGKYALARMRNIVPIYNKKESGTTLNDDEAMILHCFEYLVQKGAVQLGNEDDTQQFFVIKHGDKFALPALEAYADAVSDEITRLTRAGKTEEAERLVTYHSDIQGMINEAGKTRTKIPD